MRIPRILLAGSAAFFLASCGNSDPVLGRVAGDPYGPPVHLTVVTKSGPGGGVKISTDVGDGKQEVTLSGAETVRLIQGMDEELRNWGTLWRAEPFERTIAMGITSVSDWTPYSVVLVRRHGMRTAAFRVMIGHADVRRSFALDEKNARLWVERLKRASGYRP